MKKVGNLKVGDTAIYIQDDNIKVSKVVKKPIDDGLTRPIFKIGRKDLANGDYLINGEDVYDSLEEASTALIDKLEKDLKKYEDEKIIAEGMIILTKYKLERLNGHMAE